MGKGCKGDVDKVGTLVVQNHCVPLVASMAVLGGKRRGVLGQGWCLWALIKGGGWLWVVVEKEESCG